MSYKLVGLIALYVCLARADRDRQGSLAGLSTSIQVLGQVRDLLYKASEARWPYVDWFLGKVNVVHLYVTAGSTLAQRLDPDLLDALATATANENDLEEGRSVNHESWRYNPSLYTPSYVRKSKTKLKDDSSTYEDEGDFDDDLTGSYGHSHGSYGDGGYGGGGGGGYGGGGHGHGGGGYGGGGYGGGGHGGGYGGGGHGGGGYGGGGYGGGGYGGGHGGGGYGGGGYGGGGYGGGGYGGGGYGGDYGGHGGGGYGNGGGGYVDSSGKAFSILGGLSFLTFLGVLLYQLARSARSLHVSDMDVPLDLSDVHSTSPDQLYLMDKYLSMAPDDHYDQDEGNRLEQIADVFNTMWKAHKSGSGFRCVQRRMCETLTDAGHQRVANEALIQSAMVVMVNWLGDYDAAQMVDRVTLASSSATGRFDCSALVPKCREHSRSNSGGPTNSSRRFNPLYALRAYHP